MKSRIFSCLNAMLIKQKLALYYIMIMSIYLYSRGTEEHFFFYTFIAHEFGWKHYGLCFLFFLISCQKKLNKGDKKNQLEFNITKWSPAMLKWCKYEVFNNSTWAFVSAHNMQRYLKYFHEMKLPNFLNCST